MDIDKTGAFIINFALKSSLQAAQDGFWVLNFKALTLKLRREELSLSKTSFNIPLIIYNL